MNRQPEAMKQKKSTTALFFCVVYSLVIKKAMCKGLRSIHIDSDAQISKSIHEKTCTQHSTINSVQGSVVETKETDAFFYFISTVEHQSLYSIDNAPLQDISFLVGVQKYTNTIDIKRSCDIQFSCFREVLRLMEFTSLFVDSPYTSFLCKCGRDMYTFFELCNTSNKRKNVFGRACRILLDRFDRH